MAKMDRENAILILNEAFILANSQDSFEKEKLLSSVIRGWAKVDLEKAFEIWKSAGFQIWKRAAFYSEASSSIAYELAKIDFDEALKFSRELDNYGSLSKCLSTVAIAIAKVDLQRAHLILNEALITLREHCLGNDETLENLVVIVGALAMEDPSVALPITKDIDLYNECSCYDCVSTGSLDDFAGALAKVEIRIALAAGIDPLSLSNLIRPRALAEAAVELAMFDFERSLEISRGSEGRALIRAIEGVIQSFVEFCRLFDAIKC